MNLSFEDYLKYFDIGTRDFVIAALYDVPLTTLRYYKYNKWEFSLDKQFERKVFLYNKWHSQGYMDKDIAKLMGVGAKRIRDIKRRAGLQGETGWNLQSGRYAIALGKRKVY